MKKLIFLYFLPLVATLSLLAPCGACSDAKSLPAGDTIPVSHAEYLTMVDYGDFVKADFQDPWNKGKTRQTLLLVPRDKELPSNLPEGTVVRVPLQQSVVYTATHNALIDELGASKAIAGVCDPEYIHTESVRKGVASGKIADCGSSMSPNIEKIVMLNPDAILLSAFENSRDHNKVAQTGIPVIECIDYMETSPLGRAEWMRFFGRLYGKGEEADALFAKTEKEYNAIKSMASEAKNRPAVMSNLIYGSTWDVPGALSTVGVIIKDAGATTPFEDYKQSGGVPLAPEEVLYKAKDTDYWIIKYSQQNPMTLNQLGADNKIYREFKPYKNGNVYGCNTATSTYFDYDAFHPHWILAEYVGILHPELPQSEFNHHFFNKLEP